MNLIEISDEQMHDLVHYYYRSEIGFLDLNEINGSTSLIPCSNDDIECSLNEYHRKQTDENYIMKYNIPILRFKSNNCSENNYLELYIVELTENEPLKFNQCSLKTRTLVFFDNQYMFN